MPVNEEAEPFKLLVNNLPHVIWTASVRGSIKLINDRWSEYTGLSRESVKGPGVRRQVFHPDDLSEFEDRWSDSIENGKLFDAELRIRFAAGSYRWVQERGVPVRDSSGKIIGWVGTVTDIHDWRERAARARESFLTVAAHELRTPLTSLKLQMELISRMLAGLGAHQVSRLEQKLQAARRQVARLSVLNERLLEVARIGAGLLLPQVKQVELAQLVLDTIELLEAELARAGCSIHLDLQAELHGWWDPFKLGEVLVNLLSNAIKFGKGRSIEITSCLENDEAVLSVTDHGIGIAPEDLERIFQKFERAVPVENYGGLGLGLYLSRSMIESMGGRIRVTSRLGEGATFTVYLPRGEPRLP
ncbi:MAG: PAS domain-containing sensor histidine kinase [Myxococcaceae bacterium]|nr:PAS domain-containing sensor histidine kinase [Myxococcaceae bacterium]